ncbi:MAG TPA: isochorismatase family cysteine hydrolase [Gaiellaceae bacterium]
MSAEILHSLEEVLAPAHTALLVIDVQNDFCHPEGGLARRGNDVSRLAALLDPISRLMEEARAAGVLVICFRIVGSESTDSDAWAALSAGAEHELVPEGSWGAAYVDGLPVELADLDLVKHRHSAFVGTGLDEELRRRGIRTVVLAGGVTNVCVEGTAREAADRDYYVVVLEDATAAVRDDMHEMALTNVRRYLGLVGGRDETTEIWRAAGAAATKSTEFDDEKKGARV